MRHTRRVIGGIVPWTYQINGKQYIVLAVSNNDGAELLAYALP